MKTKSMRWWLVAGAVLVSAAGFKSLSPRELAEPAAGSAWVEPDTGMQFVWVPSGCFDMGSNDGADNEKPVHRVCIKGFYMGKYEVTQAEYEQVVGTNPCAIRCNRYIGPDRGVANVRWAEAQQMAAALGRGSVHKYRLPSEAEWEYACLAGGRHKTYCGAGKLKDLAWIDGHRYGPNSDRPQTVGGKQPNAWGLFDMLGNLTEYTQDCWHGNFVGAPSDGSAWIEGGFCYGRVIRGGSWEYSDATKATQRWYREDDGDHVSMSDGFRLVRMP